MKLHLRRIESFEAALELAPELDRHSAEFWTQFSDSPWPAGAAERFLHKHFAAPETVLVVASDDTRAQPWGLCLTGPFVDPLRGDSTPMVLVLHVDPSLRHRGVANELIEDVSRALKARGLARLAARVGHNDDALISMGERWGFVRAWEWMLRE
jgi:GNAT superfamily N-acetyltransferase